MVQQSATIIHPAPGTTRQSALCVWMYVSMRVGERERVREGGSYTSINIIHTNPPLPFPPIRGA